MKSYRPRMNFDQSHLVEVTLMYKDFKAVVVYETGGNVAGSTVLKCAIDNFEDGHLDSFPTNNVLNQKHLDFMDPDSQYSGAETIYLFKEDGSNIGFSFDDEVLGDIVISARIIEYKTNQL